ncbi:MAG: GrpB family protein [Bacillota bacterium]
MKKRLTEMSLEELWELFPIRLKEYNPEYKDWYCEEKEKIIKAIGKDKIKRINHIGSTAVEGLISKPIVDILLEVDRNINIENLKILLKNSGWTFMSYEEKPELRISFNKGYTPDGFVEKVFHLHVSYPGDPNELYFRDYLRDNDKIAKKYEKLKRELSEKYKYDRDRYTESKSRFIEKWTEQAREEYGGRYEYKEKS